MLPLGDVIRKHNTKLHSYTDFIQLYIAVSPEYFSPVDRLPQCLYDMNVWMSHNFILLNEDRTDVIIFRAKAQRATFSTSSVLSSPYQGPGQKRWGYFGF